MAGFGCPPRCKVAVSYAFDETISLPKECPGCHLDVVPDEFSERGKVIRAFVNALKSLRKADEAGKLFLEFDVST